MLSHTYNQTAKLIVTSKDKYGDQKQTSQTSISCRFRYITEVESNVNRESEEAFDAIVWVASDTAIVEGSILQIESKYWRVNRLVRARRLTDSTVQFLKAYVKRHEL